MISSLVKKVYLYTIRANLPYLSGLFLFFMIKPLKILGKRKKRGKVIFFGSLASLDDIRSLIAYSGNYKYWYFDRRLISPIINKYLPIEEVRETNYHVCDDFVKGRMLIYKYIEKMFSIIRFFFRFDIMMTSNFGYIEQQEVVRYGVENNVPVVVLYKEGLIHPSKIDILVETYINRRSQCDLFICYGEYIKESLLKNNIEGLTKNKIKVSGVPRLDYYFSSDFNEFGEEKNTILFFAFNPYHKYSLFESNETLERIRSFLICFYGYVISYAINNPLEKIIIKTKPPISHVKEVKSIMSGLLGKNELPSNIIVTNKGDARLLIRKSKVVFGDSGSTVLLEGLLAGRPVACPNFKNIIGNAYLDLFDGHDGLVQYIKTEEQFNVFVSQSEGKNCNLDNKSRMLLEKYFYSLDGKSSKRVEGHIDNLLRNTKSISIIV